MTTHELKIWPRFFQAVIDGRKRFELRKNDRGFKTWDRLFLREWKPEDEDYTGRTIMVTMTDVLSGVTGIDPGHCILSIDWPGWEECE